MPSVRRLLRVRLVVPLLLSLSALVWPVAYDVSTAQTAYGAAKVDVLISFANAPRDDMELAGIRNLGGTVKSVFHLIPAAAASVPENKLAALRGMPGVRLVDRDAKVQSQGDGIPWGIVKVRADKVHQQQQNGAGVKVAVIDTGIDPGSPDLKVAGGVAFTWYTTSWADDNGHGTHVAGTVAATASVSIVGVAPEVQLYAVKALDYNGGGAVSDVISGIEWAVDNGMNIINMSLQCSFDVPEFHQAVDAAYQAGVVLVAAAGNNGYVSGKDTVAYPARYSSVISAAATDVSDLRAAFSGVGPEAELAAPGVDILSTVPGGLYACRSGTSMSAAHVSGAVALLMGAGMTDPDEIRARLRNTAVDLGDPGADPYYGWGRLDAEAAMAQLLQAKAVDVTPPGILVSAMPNVISKVDGMWAPVQINGSTNDGAGGSGVHAFTITVTDEYGRVQPPVKHFGQTVMLEAKTIGNDRDGRTYTIAVTAVDLAGNIGTAATTVVVRWEAGVETHQRDAPTLAVARR